MAIVRIISENQSYHTKDGYDEEINKESQEYLKIIGKMTYLDIKCRYFKKLCL